MSLQTIDINQPLIWTPKGWNRKQGYHLTLANEQIIGELGYVKGFKRKSYANTPNFSWILERASGWSGEISIFSQANGEESAFLEKQFRKYLLHLRAYPELKLLFRQKGILLKEWFWVDGITGKPYLVFTQKSFFFSAYEVEILATADALSQDVWEMLLPLG
ncbi:MAG: hypothetical protein ACKVTZ_02175, partial [Bacteroidia bacterium]